MTNFIKSAPNQIQSPNPLSVKSMREQSYPGSDLVIEETLASGSNYQRYVASYKSEGLKIYGLLTIPATPKPDKGYPVIVFNHGFIQPAEYRTTERYIAYQDGFARNGYITFKSDYRGNGSSEGSPSGAYFSPAYVVDVLNAVSSLKKYPSTNPDKIGMWGHSMGGFITMKSMVISKDIKAAVIWGGVVSSYADMYKYWWGKRNAVVPSFQRESEASRSARQQLIQKYGQPKEGNSFWDEISPTSFLPDISGPIQLHHGLSDETVPWELSEQFKNRLEKANKTVEYYAYPGADHNLESPAFELAMQRSVAFFDKYLKN